MCLKNVSGRKCLKNIRLYTKDSETTINTPEIPHTAIALRSIVPKIYVPVQRLKNVFNEQGLSNARLMPVASIS